MTSPVIEIRQLGETSADWLIQQDDEYYSVRNRFDHHAIQRDVACLKEVFKAAMDAVDEFTPPAPHVM